MSTKKSFRLILWSISSTGWRGDQKAVVYDAKSIGLDEQANDSGSAYWTLDNDHPQIAEFVPLARHYEISRYSEARSRWEFVGAGMLNDYNVTEYQTTFSGLDYKAILNQVYTPLSGMTVDNAAELSTDIGTSGITTAASVPFKMEETAAGTVPRYFNTTVFDFEASPTVQTFPGTLRHIPAEDINSVPDGTNIYINNYPNYVNGVGDWSYYESPMISLSWTAVWTSSTVTSGFNRTGRFRVYASPPGYKDAGSPPLSDLGLLGELSDDTQYMGGIEGGNTIPNGGGWGPYYYQLYPQELKKLVEETEGVGSFTGCDYIATDYTNAFVSNEQDIACLRPGVSYSFQIYAAVQRTATGTNVWYRSKTGAIMGSENTASLQYGLPFKVTLGQGTEDAKTIIERALYNSLQTDPYNRLRYATLISSGSTATTHTVYTAGEPVLDHIASVCDIEMGAKTDGTKVVFGINKPTGGSSYDGNFKLSLSVSSAASSAMALRYPDNIRSFSFTPGYARVRNDITIIPTTSYLSGSSGQNSGGTSLVGATAINQDSLTSNGRIPLIAPKANLVDATAAQNEANRLLETYKPANTKQVNIRAVLDGVDLWNGWDVGDSVKLTVNRGLAVVDEPFVITGVRWFGESDGHERIELDLMQGTAFAAAYAAPIPTTEAN